MACCPIYWGMAINPLKLLDWIVALSKSKYQSLGAFRVIGKVATHCV
jgi:hypothetical protein